jgi:hypothetical protein
VLLLNEVFLARKDTVVRENSHGEGEDHSPGAY